MSTYLVPLDGSARAEQALSLALPLLADADELALLRVVDSVETADKETAESYLRELVVRLHEGGLECAVRLLVRAGNPYEEILQAARLHANHLVLTSHGRTGMLRVILGSVAESLLRLSPCPVWLVPAQPEPHPYGPDWQAPQLPGPNLVVPLDGSGRDARTLAFLQGWKPARSARLTLLAAVDTLLPLGAPPPDSLADYLKARARELSDWGLAVRTRVSERRPLAAILEEPADLVVLSIHQHSGSVAERLGRRARCPLVFLPHDLRHGFPGPQPRA
jgi:nucleotide-binding universal stress UspA family protein